MKSTLIKMNPPEKLLSLIAAQTAQEVPQGLKVLAEAARSQHGDSVRAVLFYGSCLRSGNVHDGLADLYLLVDSYRSAFKGRFLALFNWLLPPNVFYLEVPFESGILRAKYAVLTVDDFHKGTTRWFHSYLWGRFSQPCSLAYSYDDRVARQVHDALARASMTFVSRTLPQMEQPFTARDLWAKGLSLSYRSELRTEKSDGAVRLFDATPEYFQEMTHSILTVTTSVEVINNGADAAQYQVLSSPRRAKMNRLSWSVRALQGKLLSVLRLLKGLLTFKGGVDYILWKIERHSGSRIEVGPGLKRIPPLAIIVIFWRLYRQGAFR